MEKYVFAVSEVGFVACPGQKFLNENFAPGSFAEHPTVKQYTDKDGIQRDLAMATWNGKVIIIDDSMPVETDDAGEAYTTYVLGEGAFVYEDLGVKVPYEMDRDPAKNGGEDTLYIRERKVLAPRYISYKDESKICPDETDFEKGANWELVSDNDGEYVDHKAIAIARIISRG